MSKLLKRNTLLPNFKKNQENVRKIVTCFYHNWKNVKAELPKLLQKHFSHSFRMSKKNRGQQLKQKACLPQLKYVSANKLLE